MTATQPVVNTHTPTQVYRHDTYKLVQTARNPGAMDNSWLSTTSLCLVDVAANLIVKVLTDYATSVMGVVTRAEDFEFLDRP